MLLTRGTSGILSLMGLRCVACPAHWRMFSSIPRPCPLTVQSTHLLFWYPKMSPDVVKRFLEMGQNAPIPLELLALVNRKKEVWSSWGSEAAGKSEMTLLTWRPMTGIFRISLKHLFLNLDHKPKRSKWFYWNSHGLWPDSHNLWTIQYSACPL